MNSAPARWPIERSWNLRLPDGQDQIVSTEALASQNVVVLIGPAGIGKTTELQALMAADKALGRQTRHLRLAEHCSSTDSLLRGFGDILHDATSATVICLDALDEALALLPTAIIPLASTIRGQLKSTRPFLRIACRSAVWPPSLSDAIQEAFSIKPGCHGSPQVPTAYLQPLNNEQVYLAATAEHLDAAAFMKAIEKARVLTLAQHPVTLRLLVREFREARRLPSTRAELFSRGISRLLTENQDRRDIGITSDVSALLESASRLACFSVFSGKSIVDLSDDPEPDSLTLQDLGASATPLSEHDLLALRRTGLFDSAGDRRFEFSHRQFAEFLAGRRIGQDVPTNEAKKMLSTAFGPDAGIAGPLRETAAFAAHYSKELRLWLAKTDPEVVALSEIADDLLKRLATKSLLNAFRDQQLTDGLIRRDGFDLVGLKYANASKDIAPLLQERGTGAVDLLECAIELVDQWELPELADDLATLMLDPTAPHEARKSAGYTLSKLPAHQNVLQARARLKPLLRKPRRGNPNELTGLALRCLWPTLLTPQELLAALPVRHHKSYFGALEGFIYDLDKSGFDASECPLEGLRWTLRYARGGDERFSDNPFQRLALRVARAAIAKADHPKVVSALANVVSAFARAGTAVFPAPDEGDDGATSQPVTIATRRRLVLAISLQPLQESDRWMVLSEIRGLLSLDDFKWYLDEATNPARPMPQREFLADCLRFIRWQDDPKYFDLWLSLHHLKPLNSRVDVPLSCPIVPAARAKELRDTYYRLNSPPRKSRRDEGVRDARALIRQLLDKCETDTPRWFARLARSLPVKNGDTHEPLNRIPTLTPGWAAADASTRKRIREAALRYLSLETDKPESCRNEPLNSIFMDGYVPALLLLQEEQPRWLSGQSEAWWARWSWYIAREMHFDMHGEENEPKHRLFSAMLDKAWPAFMPNLIGLIEKPEEDAKSLATRLLRQIEEFPCPGLDHHLWAGIQAGHIPNDRLREVAEFLVYREGRGLGPAGVSDRLLSLATSRGQKTELATPLLVALLSQALAARWKQVLDAIGTSTQLARSVLSAFLHSSRLRSHIQGTNKEAPSIPSEVGVPGVLQLIIALLRAFPPQLDPRREGAYWSGPVDSARDSRDSLISWLGNQNSREAVAALRQLESAFGSMYPWLRRPRSRAERQYRVDFFEPVPVCTIAAILSAARRCLIRSPIDALDAISEAVSDLERDHLKGGNSMMLERLWNTCKAEQPSPKPEEHVSDEIQHAIAMHLERYAAVANREVSLYRRVLPKKRGGLPGDEVDVLFSIPASGTTSGTTISIPIEVKFAHNPEIRTALRRQLYERYMKHANTDFGVFVAVFMTAPSCWKTPSLTRVALQNQADEIRDETAGAVTIRVLVVDAQIPGAHKRLSRSKDARTEGRGTQSEHRKTTQSKRSRRKDS